MPPSTPASRPSSGRIGRRGRPSNTMREAPSSSTHMSRPEAVM
jgi:hypothetical protein